MRSFKLLIILALISFQASATGYVHNMFVAHKKFQAVKEVIIEKVTVKTVKAKPAAKATKPVAKTVSATPISTSFTLNERILEEGPAALFENEKDARTDNSIVTKLIDAFRCMIYTFVGSALGKS